VLAKWGTELSHDGKFQEALEVLTTGLALAPQDATLVNNHSAVWSQWALSAVDAGNPAEALAILERAATAVPGGGFQGMQSLVYIRPADARMREGRWEDALAAAVPGFEVLAGEPRKELEKWLGYFAQEWSTGLAKKEGEAEALVALRGLAVRFPGNEYVTSAADSHVRRMAYGLADAGKFEAALEAIQEAKDLMQEAAGVREVSLYVYDNWAKRHMKDGQWEQAADVYVKALTMYPEAELIKQNVAYLGQEWTKAAYAKGGTPAAATVARALKAKFPQVGSVAKSGGKEVARAVHDSIENGKFEVALAAVDQGKELLTGDEAQELYFAAYDGWAKRHMQDGQWEKAADVYSAGLARFPAMEKLQRNIGWFAQEWAKEVAAAHGPDKAADVLRALKQRFPGVKSVARSAENHLNNTVNALVRDGKQEEALAVLERLKDLAEGEANVERLAVFAYDRWARTFIDNEDWDGAIAIYDKGLAEYPNQGLFKQNKAYCIEQKSR